jgi:phosphatidylglycerol:prolipoprotein diacylglycerol transferase
MHPYLIQIGSFPIGTYGLLLALGFFAGTALAKRQGRLDGIEGEFIPDLAITLLLAGILGAKVVLIIVEMINGRMGVADIFSLATLRAGGHIHGGIILGAAAFFWKTRKAVGHTVAQIGDALVPGVALGQAIGRLGCFAAGCCFGTSCSLPWAVTFKDPHAFELSGTPLGLPLHPVQLYTFLANLAVMSLLLLARKGRRFQGQVTALYFMLEGVARLTVETWRGDLDRGMWLGISWLSTGRLTALAFLAFGVGLWVWWSHKGKDPVNP